MKRLPVKLPVMKIVVLLCSFLINQAINAQYIVRVSYGFDSDEYIYMETPNNLYTEVLSIQEIDSIYETLKSFGMFLNPDNYGLPFQLNSVFDPFSDSTYKAYNISDWSDEFPTFIINTEVSIPCLNKQDFYIGYMFRFEVWKFEGEMIFVDCFGNKASNYNEAVMWNRNNKVEGKACHHCFFPVIKKLENLKCLDIEDRRKFGF